MFEIPSTLKIEGRKLPSYHRKENLCKLVQSIAFKDFGIRIQPNEIDRVRRTNLSLKSPILVKLATLLICGLTSMLQVFQYPRWLCHLPHHGSQAPWEDEYHAASLAAQIISRHNRYLQISSCCWNYAWTSQVWAASVAGNSTNAVVSACHLSRRWTPHHQS